MSLMENNCDYLKRMLIKKKEQENHDTLWSLISRGNDRKDVHMKYKHHGWLNCAW